MAEQLVRLKYLESDNFAPGGGIGIVDNTVVSAKVKNVAFAKDVALHYLDASSGNWREAALTWQRNIGNYDLFSHSDGTFTTTRFVVRYTVEGNTFWDNNEGRDYFVDEGQPNTVGGNVALNKAVARRGTQAGGGLVFTTSWIEGEIFVKNLSFNKKVGVRVTTNGWLTSHDTLATFSAKHGVAEGLSQVEIWKFKTPELNLDNASPNFELAIFYLDLDNGKAFWDNNFGQNYVLSKQDQTTDE